MQTRPIELHYWSTPNGRKISIMLEEIGAPYEVTFVDIDAGEQRRAEFGVVSAHRQIPAIVDPEGPGDEPIAIFETGAILMYLARKFGRFYPIDDERRRVEVETWLIWQVANFGPFLGQAHHFNLSAPEEIPYAIERYAAMTRRLYATLEARLAGRDFVAVGDYTIADIAIYPWVARHLRHHIDLAAYPNVLRWYQAVGSRPAVRRGMAVIKPGRVDVALPEPAWRRRVG